MVKDIKKHKKKVVEYQVDKDFDDDKIDGRRVKDLIEIFQDPYYDDY